MSIWAKVEVTISKTFAVEIEDDETVFQAGDKVSALLMDKNYEIESCWLPKDVFESETFQRLADEKITL